MALFRHFNKSFRADRFKSSIARYSGIAAGNLNADFGVARPNIQRNQYPRQKLQDFRRQFSTRIGHSSQSSPMRMNPSYQIYGETCAFTVKAILPEYRVLGSSIVLDARKRGRLLLEWSPRNLEGRFMWDAPIRFGLSVEEAGLLISKVSTSNLQPLEFVRTTPPIAGGGESNYADMVVPPGRDIEKVFRVTPHSDGTVDFLIDFELDGVGGQAPPSAKESRGPLEFEMMAGEYQVVKSIFEHSIPRLSGWAPMMDHAMEKSIIDRINGAQYGGARGGGPESGGYGLTSGQDSDAY